jgi:thiol-disulfide isomerase/thioredoxin
VVLLTGGLAVAAAAPTASGRDKANEQNSAPPAQRASAPSASGLDSGRPATLPDLTLTRLDGKPLKLSGLRGQWVVIDFFATWCGPCRDELPHLIALQRREARSGLQVVGISLDDEVAPVRELVASARIPYPVAMGDETVAERFGGVLGLPMLFLVDPTGRIVSMHQGEGSLGAIQADLAKARGKR